MEPLFGRKSAKIDNFGLSNRAKNALEQLEIALGHKK